MKNKLAELKKPLNLHVNLVFQPPGTTPVTVEIQFMHEDIHALAKESHHLYTIARVGSVEELHGNATVSGEVQEGHLERLVTAGRERQVSARRSMDGDLEEGVPRPFNGDLEEGVQPISGGKVGGCRLKSGIRRPSSWVSDLMQPPVCDTL